MGASACLTLATVHLVIWCKQTEQLAHLLFSVTAISVAAIAACELLIMHAQSPEQLGRAIWWAHIPVFFAIASIVGFVRLYFNAGRPWLGYAVCGLRLLEDLIINFFSVPNVNYDGLRYNNIHSTALCAPTRAALITGRNHHSAGFGVISEQSTGFPGYNSIIAKDKATIGRILKENGYATSWFGKDHNVPAFNANQVGPFDNWPIGQGFEYFYGFVGGDANQWQPNLFRNTTQIYPFDGKPGWNLVTGMADDAIDYLNRINQISPDKPFFCYYVPGATHAPHHPTKKWVDKIHNMHLFDEGWNKLCERIFENQKRLGVIPPDTQIEPWPTKVIKNWDDCTPEEKKLFIRQVEIFAAYEAYDDHEIGRVGGRSHCGPASEHHRWSHGVCVHQANDWPAAGRFANVAQRLLHHHG
jgi:Sulfatase